MKHAESENKIRDAADRPILVLMFRLECAQN